jgi:hypothetical protein
MTEDTGIAVRALVYAGDREDMFPQQLVVVSSTSSVQDLVDAFKARIKSDSNYDGWGVITVWKVSSCVYFYPTLRAENAIL